MVVLEGADHVKYGMGSVGRMKRMAPSFQVVAATSAASAASCSYSSCVYVCVCVCVCVCVRAYILSPYGAHAPLL